MSEYYFILAVIFTLLSLLTFRFQNTHDMATNQEMQAQRFETKFIVPESLGIHLRAFIASYLEQDAYSAKSPISSYEIHSIYFDTPMMHTVETTENGDRNRFKLRIRYYDESPDTPVFFEMKRRFNDIIHKARCTVPRAALEQALSGDSSSIKEKERASYHSFMNLMFHFGATPRAHVAYLREAWMSREDNSVRVTLDRAVRVEPKFDLHTTTQMKNPVTVFENKIVLELKFTDRFPEWFREMTRFFNLVQSGAPKYSGGVKMYGKQHFKGQLMPIITTPLISGWQPEPTSVWSPQFNPAHALRFQTA